MGTVKQGIFDRMERLPQKIQRLPDGDGLIDQPGKAFHHLPEFFDPVSEAQV
jgi:hypothetical protein